MNANVSSTGSVVSTLSCRRGIGWSFSVGPLGGRLPSMRTRPRSGWVCRPKEGAMDPRDLVDELAEVLVVPSFTRTGFRLRRRLYGWPDAASYRMDGRTVVLTGPTSGLGREAAGSFARMGARL